jgi:hypothetical protein
MTTWCSDARRAECIDDRRVLPRGAAAGRDGVVDWVDGLTIRGICGLLSICDSLAVGIEVGPEVGSRRG